MAVKHVSSVLDEVLDKLKNGERLNDFIDGCKLALDVSVRFFETHCKDLDEIGPYAKQRIRYFYSDPMQLVMADALIDHLMQGVVYERTEIPDDDEDFG